jgi:hypothetical protein
MGPVLRGIIIAAAWLACIAAAAAPVLRHQYTPGAGSGCERWPAQTGLARSDRTPTLVLVAHARCPCVWASLDELDAALTAAPDGLRAYVVVVTPPGVAADERLVERARRLPGTSVVADDGTEARRFDVSTSGQVLMYDRAGQRVFGGGITASRGHRGGNAGADTVAAIARGQRADSASMPVFGCPLAGPAAAGDACPGCVAGR